MLTVVLPDDDDDHEPHPWSWLSDLARARGLDVTADDLRALPYDVVFTDELRRMARGLSRGNAGARLGGCLGEAAWVESVTKAKWHSPRGQLATTAQPTGTAHHAAAVYGASSTRP